MQIRSADPLAAMLTSGTVIWRPVRFDSRTFETTAAPCDLERSGRPHQKFARLRLEPDWIWEPTVASAHETGLIIFTTDELPPNWTHLAITGVSNTMRESPRKHGGAVFASVAQPCMELHEYLAWRNKIAQHILLQTSERFTECLATSKRFPASTGLQRLVFNHSEVPGIEYEYQHFEDGERVLETAKS